MRRLALVAGLVSTVGLLAVTGRATDAELTVAQVGPVPIAASELTRRLQGAPRIQLRYMGPDARTARRAFLEKIVIRELLWSQLAEARGLAMKVEVRERMDATLAAAAATSVLETSAPVPVTPEEVSAYYDDHVDQYQTPATLTLWHISVATEEEAREVLEDMHAHRDPKSGVLSSKRWAVLARERSLDERTRERGGNLGVVRPDGSSSSAGVAVDGKILEAARGVRDLELVANPVVVGDRFSVVWRRKGGAGVQTPLKVVADTIRRELEVKRRADALKAWTEQQVKLGRVQQYRPELLEL